MDSNFSVCNYVDHGRRFGERLAQQTMRKHSKTGQNWWGTGLTPGGNRERWGKTLGKPMRHSKIPPPSSILFISNEAEGSEHIF